VLLPLTTTAAVDISLGHINHCIIGILERFNDTKSILKNWLPWLDINYITPEKRRMRISNYDESKETLPKEVYELLLSKNECDMMIYEAMVKRFETQLQYLDKQNNELDYYFVPHF
jgi:hypothetical protein